MLSKQYQAKCKQEKQKFFKNIVRQAKESDPNGWYRLLKRISNHDSGQKESLVVEEISHLTDKEQVEALASAFNAPSQKYQPLQISDIKIPDFSPDSLPEYTPSQIKQYIDEIKTNKATIPGDIPAKVLKRYSEHFCVPLADIINTCIKTGVWPDRYKKEIITPIAKVSPTETLSQVRPISNLPLCDKIFESVISDMIVQDMKLKLDPKQYGNQKGLGIQHYLVEMLHRILSGVDNNSKGEITAVLCLFVDWKSAYSNQCHKLGVESFIENGVRPCLIPLIINYFQNREMKVKFRDQVSQSQKQPGSGAQGASLGNHEFLSQTNHNADSVPKSDGFKFVDDLSCL